MVAVKPWGRRCGISFPKRVIQSRRWCHGRLGMHQLTGRSELVWPFAGSNYMRHITRPVGRCECKALLPRYQRAHGKNFDYCSFWEFSASQVRQIEGFFRSQLGILCAAWYSVHDPTHIEVDTGCHVHLIRHGIHLMLVENIFPKIPNMRTVLKSFRHRNQAKKKGNRMSIWLKWRLCSSTWSMFANLAAWTSGWVATGNRRGP